jgi:hypothetical protein
MVRIKWWTNVFDLSGNTNHAFLWIARDKSRCGDQLTCANSPASCSIPNRNWYLKLVVDETLSSLNTRTRATAAFDQPWRSSTAGRVLLAGTGIPENLRIRRSRILRAP